MKGRNLIGSVLLDYALSLFDPGLMGIIHNRSLNELHFI